MTGIDILQGLPNLGDVSSCMRGKLADGEAPGLGSSLNGDLNLFESILSAHIETGLSASGLQTNESLTIELNPKQVSIEQQSRHNHAQLLSDGVEQGEKTCGDENTTDVEDVPVDEQTPMSDDAPVEEQTPVSGIEPVQTPDAGILIAQAVAPVVIPTTEVQSAVPNQQTIAPTSLNGDAMVQAVPQNNAQVMPQSVSVDIQPESWQIHQTGTPASDTDSYASTPVTQPSVASHEVAPPQTDNADTMQQTTTGTLSATEPQGEKSPAAPLLRLQGEQNETGGMTAMPSRTELASSEYAASSVDETTNLQSAATAEDGTTHLQPTPVGTEVPLEMTIDDAVESETQSIQMDPEIPVQAVGEVAQRVHGLEAHATDRLTSDMNVETNLEALGATPVVSEPIPAEENSGDAQLQQGDSERISTGIETVRPAQQEARIFDITAGSVREVQPEPVPAKQSSGPELIEQIVQRAHVDLSAGRKELAIRLDPPELGQIHVRVLSERGAVTAHLEASTPVVRELLQSNIDLLRESLQKANIDIGQCMVSLASDQNAQGWNRDEMAQLGGTNTSLHESLRDQAIDMPSHEAIRQRRQDGLVLDYFA